MRSSKYLILSSVMLILCIVIAYPGYADVIDPTVESPTGGLMQVYSGSQSWNSVPTGSSKTVIYDLSGDSKLVTKIEGNVWFQYKNAGLELSIYTWDGAKWNLIATLNASANNQFDFGPYEVLTKQVKFVYSNTSGITASCSINPVSLYGYYLTSSLKLAQETKTAANTAAARSYYNGNTSGYWSYNANVQAYYAKAILDGSENGGKSLAATYDKANAASEDTTYIRNTQLPGIATDASNAATNATAAKTAADTAATNASAAKSSADTAASRALTAVNQTFYNGKSAAEWAQIAALNAGTDSTAPVINKVEGQNGATCTTSTSYKLIIAASDNNPSNLKYRVICDAFDSGWVSSNSIIITGLTTTGAKTATIRVSDNPDTPEFGNIAQTTHTFFKL